MKPVVISGCSGGGKSTLIAELARRGFAVSEEPARAVIREEGIRPDDVAPFVAAVLRREVVRLRSHAGAFPVFFDRSVIEMVNFARRRGLDMPDHLADIDLGNLFHETVFFAPPWRAIYTNDAERTHDFESAAREHDQLVEAYSRAGYEIVALPKVGVAERADFVVERLGL